jgi:secreted trypsin-like serine protease
MKQTPWNLRCPALVAATISLVGCGVDPNEFSARPTSGVHQPITAGEPADADTAAVLVVATAGAQTGFCSGVVVSPYAVLTAAHCVDDTFDYRIFVAADFNDADAQAREANFVSVSDMTVHPDYSTATNLNDIAVLITDAPLPIAPVALGRRALGADDIGAPVRIVGYGQRESGGPMGQRRAAMSSIAGIDPTGLAMTGTPNICLFDSGGPTLREEDGVVVVIGVHSLVDSAACDGMGIDTRVDAYTDFIDSQIAAAEPPPAEPDVDVEEPEEPEEPTPAGCTTSGAESRPAVSLLAAALLVSARRRQQRTAFDQRSSTRNPSSL